MITGILNSVVQLDLSQTDVDKFKVLEINYTKKEIILSNGSKKLECKILHPDQDLRFVHVAGLGGPF